MKTHKNSKLFEWQKRCKSGTEKCAKCGETRALTVDHIVPVFLLEQLGTEEMLSHDMELNYEILCVYCNRQKGSRLDVRNPKMYEVLEIALQQAKKYYIPTLFE